MNAAFSRLSMISTVSWMSIYYNTFFNQFPLRTAALRYVLFVSRPGVRPAPRKVAFDVRFAAFSADRHTIFCDLLPKT